MLHRTILLLIIASSPKPLFAGEMEDIKVCSAAFVAAAGQDISTSIAEWEPRIFSPNRVYFPNENVVCEVSIDGVYNLSRGTTVFMKDGWPVGRQEIFETLQESVETEVARLTDSIARLRKLESSSRNELKVYSTNPEDVISQARTSIGDILDEVSRNANIQRDAESSVCDGAPESCDPQEVFDAQKSPEDASNQIDSLQRNADHSGNSTPEESSFTASGTANLGRKYWVTADRLNRRTCPSIRCGVVGQLFFRDGLEVYEVQGDWARVSQPYDASCVDGQSSYVDSGASSCDEENGIRNGLFSEWASFNHVSLERPPDPAQEASEREKVISRSDDFIRYRVEFTESAELLISDGRCSEQDFHDEAGWTKSTSHRNQPVYFIRCQDRSLMNRWYLNAATKEIFQ